MATPTLSIYPYPAPVTWRVKAGTTLSGYDPNYPGQAFKTTTFTSDSSANADADVYVSWDVSPAPIPKGGPFLRVTNGIFGVQSGHPQGLLIVKALVTVDSPAPNPIPSLPSINPLAYPPRFQFGQPGAPCDGKSCCTDTCVQMILEYWTEKFQTLSDIRYWAEVGSTSNTSPCTGINPGETLNALKHYGVDFYKVATGVDANFVKSKVTSGYTPVLIGVYYGSYPNIKTGKCGTFNLAREGGRTDCTFKGSHAIIALGSNNGGLNVVTRDPDHASPARPEKPHHDSITWAQLDKTMKDLPRYTNWNVTFCIYPLKKKVL